MLEDALDRRHPRDVIVLQLHCGVHHDLAAGRLESVHCRVHKEPREAGLAEEAVQRLLCFVLKQLVVLRFRISIVPVEDKLLVPEPVELQCESDVHNRTARSSWYCPGEARSAVARTDAKLGLAPLVQL